MNYKIKQSDVKLDTSNIKIATSVLNVIKKDNFTRRKHAFNVTGAQRHKVFYAKDKFHRALKESTNIDPSEYFDGLDDSLFNHVSRWEKKEIKCVLDHLHSPLRNLVNHPIMQKHSMDSIRIKRCDIRNKRIPRLSMKILCWLKEFGYIN